MLKRFRLLLVVMMLFCLNLSVGCATRQLSSIGKVDARDREIDQAMLSNDNFCTRRGDK